MAYVQGLNVVLTADTTGLSEAMNKIETRSRKLNSELRDVNRSLKFDPKNTDLLAQKTKILNERYQETSKKLELMRSKQEEVNRAFKNNEIDEDAYRQFQTEIATTESRLEGFREQLKETSVELAYQNSEIGRISNKVSEVGDSFENASRKMLPYSAAASAAIVGFTKSASDWESAWVDVLKVTDGTDEQMANLSKSIRNMSKELPVSAVEIAGVVEAASKLGVSIDHVEDFAETMVKMEIATGISAADSATAIARFAEITNMSFDDVDRLGSVIAELGDNYATTEKEIIDMSMGLAAAGSQVGMHQSDIMALATALSSVGLEAQAGGSAMSKLMISMELATQTGEGLDGFLKVTNTSASEFKDIFQNDATRAISMFIEGLKDIDESGGSTIKVLDDMGIKEVRLRDTLLRAANASDTFTGAIKDGSRAWEENTKLNEEAELQADTLANQWETLKNRFIEVSISLGEQLMPHLKSGVEWLGKLADKFGNMSPEMQGFIVKSIAVTAASAPVLGAMGKMFKAVGTVGEGFGKTAIKLGLFNKDAGMASVGALEAGTSLGKLTSKVIGAGGELGLLGSIGTKAGNLLGLAFNPGGAAVAGLALIGGGIYGTVKAGKKLKESLEEEVIPEVDLFADHLDTTGLHVDEFGNTVGAVSVEISEETKEVLGSYMEMSEGVLETFKGMYYGTQEMTEDSLYDLRYQTHEMTEFYKQESKKQKDNQIEVLSEMFTETKDITKEEQEAIIQMINQDHEDRVEKTEKLKEELNALYEEMNENDGNLTEDKAKRVEEILRELNEDSVDLMAQNEQERNVILARMNGREERLSAEHASQMIQDMNRVRDETIQAAASKRDEQLRIAEQIRAKGGKEAEQTANKLIKEANRQYDATKKAAEKTRDEGVQKIIDANKDMANNVDTDTGKILTKWDKVKNWWNNWFPKPKKLSVQNEGGKYNNGLAYVPYNNFQALLHRGERVLTASENRQLQSQGFIGSQRAISRHIEQNYNNSQTIVQNTASIDENSLAHAVSRAVAHELEGVTMQVDRRQFGHLVRKESR